MKMLHYIIIGLLFFLANSCQKSDPPTPQPPVFILEDTLELLASAPLTTDLRHFFVHSMHLRDQGLVFHFYEPFGPDTVKSVNPEDLQQNWAYTYRNTSDPRTYCTDQYYYYASLTAARHKLDLDTGEDRWQYLYPQDGIISKYFTVIDGYGYSAFNYEGRQVLARVDIRKNHVVWEDVFERRDSSIDRGDFAFPSSWIDENGDTILVFQHRILRDVNQQSGDLFSYNLSQRQIMWHQEDLTGDINTNSNIARPLIIGDVVAFGNFAEILGFNKHNGELLWSFPIPEQLSDMSFIKANGKVIIQPNNSNTTYAIDPNDGTLVWKTEESGSTNSRVYAYQDKLYITSQAGPLFVLNVDTGEILGQYYSPYYRQGHKDKRAHAIYDANLESPVAIDSINGLIYLSDGYYLMKCKLPL